MKKNSINLDSIVEEVDSDDRQARTIKLDKLIADRYREGYLIKDIVEEFDISQGSVYNSLSREGMSLRNTVNNSKSAIRIDNMTALEKLSLKQDYENGMAMTQIYEKYDINKHGCYMLLDELGAERRRDGNETTQEETHTTTEEEMKEDMLQELENKQKENQTPTPKMAVEPTKDREKTTINDGKVTVSVNNTTNQEIESITILFKTD